MKDIKNGGYSITFNVESLMDVPSDIDLDIQVKPFKKKRSLDANALMWAMIGRLSNKTDVPAWDIYLQMLKTYGQFTYICVKPSAVEAVKAQWREVQELGKVNINGTEAVQLLCFFGSHTYNTKEFTKLLNGVIDECKMQGIETPADEELRRALEEYEKHHKQR